MAALTTYTHSVTINPGESFILPPGSSILYTTDNDGLESVCADLPTESLACYGVVVFAQPSNGDGQVDLIENGTTLLTGISINGVTTTFAGSPQIADFAGLQYQMNLSGLLPLFVDMCSSGIQLNAGYETLKVIYAFKTIPSIGDKMEFVATTNAANVGAGNPNTGYTYKVYPLSDIIAQGHTPICLDCEES